MHCALEENCLQIILTRTLSTLLLVFNILVVSHSTAPFYPTGRLHTEINQKIRIQTQSAALPALIDLGCNTSAGAALRGGEGCRGGDGASPLTTLPWSRCTRRGAARSSAPRAGARWARSGRCSAAAPPHPRTTPRGTATPPRTSSCTVCDKQQLRQPAGLQGMDPHPSNPCKPALVSPGGGFPTRTLLCHMPVTNCCWPLEVLTHIPGESRNQGSRYWDGADGGSSCGRIKICRVGHAGPGDRANPHYFSPYEYSCLENDNSTIPLAKFTLLHLWLWLAWGELLPQLSALAWGHIESS